jgi:hypothetical protein
MKRPIRGQINNLYYNSINESNLVFSINILKETLLWFPFFIVFAII